jgi:hypothetical protein
MSGFVCVWGRRVWRWHGRNVQTGSSAVRRILRGVLSLSKLVCYLTRIIFFFFLKGCCGERSWSFCSFGKAQWIHAQAVAVFGAPRGLGWKAGQDKIRPGDIRSNSGTKKIVTKEKGINLISCLKIWLIFEQLSCNGVIVCFFQVS